MSDQGRDSLVVELVDAMEDLFARRDELEALRAELADLREEVERMRRSGPAW